ncbi:hypothetical protein ACA910_009773 [Epithemia clementina (nom. ined.)]
MVLFLITYAVMGRKHDNHPCSRSSGSGEGGHRPTKMQKFLAQILQLLQQQDVVKIVMSEECNQMPNYLRSNAVRFSSGVDTSPST